MAKDSSIEWTHHTFNPWLGCVEVSPACDHCYARKLVTGRMGLPVWGKDAPRKETSKNYWHQPFAWDRAAERAGERHRVFCGSLCDVMEDRRDLDRIRGDLYKLIESTPNLDWLLLTKRPQNFRKFLPAEWIANPRPNVWGMSTVESAEYLWRVVELLQAPFVVRGLSCEPLLGPLDLTNITVDLSKVNQHLIAMRRARGEVVTQGSVANYPPALRLNGLTGVNLATAEMPGIDWIIAGGESGAKALPVRPMHPDWARGIRDQCVAAGVAFFFKQWGEYLPDEQNAEMAQAGRGLAKGWQAIRVGKKAGGRLLDGREWNELPGARA